MVDEDTTDKQKITQLENEISSLKDEIKKLREDLKRTEEGNKKIHDSVLESNKSNVYWNKVIGIGTVFSSLLTMIALLFSIYKYLKKDKKSSK